MFSVRFWVFCAGLLVGVAGQAFAQPWQPHVKQSYWWRNTATLDMDFANNRYMVSLTAPVRYTSLTQFITAVSGTFTRAGANETATGDPFYLAANQSFVSRATSTTQLTATGSPFYADASQAFYSRASTGTYFDSSGVMQTAASNVARTNYIYNGSSWVLGGTLIETSRTNYVINNIFSGASAGSPGNPGTGWSYGSYGSLSREVVGTGTEDGIPYIDLHFYGTNAGASISPQIYNTSLTTCSEGQTWAATMHARLVGGSLTGILQAIFALNQHTSASTYIKTAFNASNASALTSLSTATSLASSRYTNSGTLTGTGTTALCSFSLGAQLASSATVDFTLRFGGAQMELGASPTSYIATSGSTVTRAADVYTQQTASYFDSTGTLKFATAGAARGDYHPSTLAYRGILAEPARTNLVKYSSQPGSGNWYYLPSYTTITADSAVAPDGTLTADRVSTTAYMIAPGLGVVSGTTYTFSVWLKSPTGTSQSYNLWIEDSAPSDVTLATRSVVANGSWQRFSISATAPSQTSNFRASVRVGDYYMWGAQVEAGSSPSSYIPTWATTASRAADVYTAPNSGTYFDSTGTLRNAPANTPRLDYDPSTTEAKGVLIEESRTNLAPEIAKSSWLNYGAVTFVTNTDVAPDGTSTAHSFTCNGVAPCARYIGPSVTSGTTYTFSFFSKAPSGGVLCRPIRSGSASIANGSTYYTYVGNGWYRRFFTETITSSGTWLPQIGNDFADKPCLVWGGQIEVGSFPTSYIPTSASSVTRAADVFTMPTSTGWYTQGQGTLLANGQVPTAGNTYSGLVALDDGTANNGIQELLSLNGNSHIAIEIWNGGAFSGTGGATLAETTPGDLMKAGAAFDAVNFRGAFDGSLLNTNTRAVPTMSLLRVGNGRGGLFTLNGWTRRVVYFPTRQPDESLPDYTR